MTARESILSKVKKMLALAGNTSNEHEASLAAAKAHEFLTMHNMCIEDVDELSDEDTGIIEEEAFSGSKLPSWRKWLVIGASRAFGCNMLTRTSYPGGTVASRKRSLALVGTKGDVEVAATTIAYLSDAIDRLTRKEAMGRGRTYANSYRLGATNRIVERLKGQAAANQEEAEVVSTSAGRELVVVKGEKLKEHMSQYRTVSQRRVDVNPDAYRRGQVGGESVGLDPQVGSAPARNLGGG